MGRKSYSPEFRAEVLVRLAVNKYDFDKTARETGVSPRSIHNWNKEFPNKSVPELLERAIQRVLMVVPEDMPSKDWAITLGILLDKWMIWKGMPTSRMEQILKSVGSLPEDEYGEVLDEAERIIAEAGRSSTGSSDS